MGTKLYSHDLRGPPRPGLGNMRPAKHLNVARELHLRLLKQRYFDLKACYNLENYLLYYKKHLNLITHFEEINPYFQRYKTCTGPRIPNLSLMWLAKPKELPTSALGSRFWYVRITRCSVIGTSTVLLSEQGGLVIRIYKQAWLSILLKMYGQ